MLNFCEIFLFVYMENNLFTFLLICPLRPREGKLKAFVNMSAKNGSFFGRLPLEFDGETENAVYLRFYYFYEKRGKILFFVRKIGLCKYK